MNTMHARTMKRHSVAVWPMSTAEIKAPIAAMFAEHPALDAEEPSEANEAPSKDQGD